MLEKNAGKNATGSKASAIGAAQMACAVGTIGLEEDVMAILGGKAIINVSQ